MREGKELSTLKKRSGAGNAGVLMTKCQVCDDSFCLEVESFTLFWGCGDVYQAIGKSSIQLAKSGWKAHFGDKVSP